MGVAGVPEYLGPRGRVDVVLDGILGGIFKTRKIYFRVDFVFGLAIFLSLASIESSFVLHLF